MAAIASVELVVAVVALEDREDVEFVEVAMEVEVATSCTSCFTRLLVVDEVELVITDVELGVSISVEVGRSTCCTGRPVKTS